ncbi:MAG: SoxR reducing system RseC family protein [Candidatus Omnitrophica bacterium]|nr:SoxR reducing system RseC family protein [Candidatus Omnitrophota bacterium]
MLKKKAKVVAKEGNKLVLSFEREGGCVGCRNFFCKVGQGKLTVKAKGDFKIGEEVELRIRSSSFFLLTILTFLVPSLLFILVLVFLKNLGVFLSFLLSISILFIYFFFLNYRLRKRVFCQVARKEEE